MAGFFSNMFDSAADGGSEAYEQSQEIAVEEAFEFEETVSVGHSESVTYESADGSSHTWSNSQDVTLTVGLDATVGAAAEASQGVATSDDGLIG
jgi:hypothetical protein